MKRRVNNFTFKDTILQIVEAFVIFYASFSLVCLLNKLYGITIKNLSFEVFYSWQLIVAPSIITFIISRLIYLWVKERHSFAMIGTSYILSEILVYGFNGFTKYILNGNIKSIILSTIIFVLYLIINFLLVSFVCASIHSLFTDRIRWRCKDDNNQGF